MANFVTIFPPAENMHLIKDVGQIPYFMGLLNGYDSKLACFKNDESYSHIKDEVKGLRLEFMKEKGMLSFVEKGVLSYLRENARNIDVLNMYHLSKPVFIYGILYKMLNPSGKLYLKTDAYNQHLTSGMRYSENALKNGVLKYLEWKFIQKADIISIENKKGLELLKEHYEYAKDKIHYLPNGVNDVYLKENFPAPLTYEEKENIIIVSGRIGVSYKRHEVLLEAAKNLRLGDWKIVFIGPVQKDFERKVKKTVEKNSHLSGRIELKGEINDRKELYNWYNRSKVCCLTSDFESFGLAFVEAMYFGNYIVGTDGMSAFDDLSHQGKYGAKLPVGDAGELGSRMQQLIDNDGCGPGLSEEIRAYCMSNFTWSAISGQLDELITQIP